MALAYKCDRCGGFFEDYTLEEVSAVRLFESKYMIHYGCGYKSIHICPGCAESLDWWFKNPVKFCPMSIDPAKCEKKKRWWQK